MSQPGRPDSLVRTFASESKRRVQYSCSLPKLWETVYVKCIVDINAPNDNDLLPAQRRRALNALLVVQCVCGRIGAGGRRRLFFLAHRYEPVAYKMPELFEWDRQP